MKGEKAKFYFFILFYYFIFSFFYTNIAFCEDCDAAKKILKDAIQEQGESQKAKYLQAIKLCPNLKEAFYNLGIYYLENKEPKKAQEEFKKSLSIKKTSACLLALGRAYMEGGDCQKAEVYFREVIIKDTLNVKARQGIALCRWKQGEVSPAIDVLQEALKINENDKITLFNLGQLYESKDETLEAKKYYEKSIKSDAMFYKPYTRLGYLLYKNNSLQEAKNTLISSLQTEPHQAFANYLLFRIYEKEGDLEKGAVSLERAMNDDRENKEYAFLLASTLIKLKQEQKAKNILLENYENLKKDYKYFSILGLAQMELGEYQDAENSFKNALRINPVSSGIYNNLGVLYKRTLNLKEAEESFKKALAIDENNIEAKKNLENLK